MPVNIAAAIQNQLLQTLLQALQTTDAQLKAGDTVEAKFMGWSDTPSAQTAAVGKPALSEALIQISGKPTTLLIEATPERMARMQPGTMLTLQVDAAASEGRPAEMRLLTIQPPRGSATETPPPASGTAAAPNRSITTTEAARAAAGPLIGAALARQNGLAPLFADLEVLIRSASQLPSPVVNTASQILGLRLNAEALEDQPLTLKAAVASSGLFHDAALAKGAPVDAANDLKGALITLRQALRDALGLLTEDQKPALASDKGDARNPRGTIEMPGAVRPQAPTREGLPVPQGVSPPSIDPGTDSGATMMTKALERTEAAIDRLNISQFASLPAASDASLGVPNNRLFMELPLALDGRTAVLPLDIEEDGGGTDGTGPQAKLWRVRFALDVEPMGPLHAMVTMQGRAIGVTVWAERDATSQLVRDHAPDLKAALLDNDFENPQIEVLAGQPMKRPAHAGHYLDRRS